MASQISSSPDPAAAAARRRLSQLVEEQIHACRAAPLRAVLRGLLLYQISENAIRERASGITISSPRDAIDSQK